ncbi:amidase [Nocardioides nematodiphilus]|uniref:amidase n=1 Tax=Nocardioides nematodiphilus TaxID=2849669 RepID=UPI001CD9B75E|nr:amidase [Nocardioides nematodiphilus]MCA1983647.1 amidase [Nocardioides nematodiphilus]
MTELHDLTALEQGELIRRCEVSPAELAEHYLARIARLDAEAAEPLGAFITVTAEQAVARAHQLAIRPPGASPLWGVPTAIKDLNQTAGIRTTFGSAVYADFVPTISDHVVEAIEAAGMVSLGKTNTPEFGSPCYTEPDVAPPAVTPWDRRRTAGGSSGGAGAAVAAGLVPLAQGSDGGGSIRIPASACGLVGLKPTRGRISGGPVYGDPVGLATAGPIARTVRDAAAFLDVMALPDPSRSETFLDACDRPLGQLRIARFLDPVITQTAVDPECVAAYERASRLLEDLGHVVEDVPKPLPAEAVATFETCWAVLTALSVTRLAPEQRRLIRPLTRWLAEWGEQISGPEFGLAIGAMRRFAAGALDALQPYDAVLTPTLAGLPPLVGAMRDDADPRADFEAQKRLTPWTSAWNVTGMPAISLPLHHAAGDVPVGVMLAARPGEEQTLLALSAQIEAAAPWADRHPPLW